MVIVMTTHRYNSTMFNPVKTLTDGSMFYSLDVHKWCHISKSSRMKLHTGAISQGLSHP